MNDNIESIRNRIKSKRDYSLKNPFNNNFQEVTSSHFKYIKNLFSRTLISLIFVLLSVIYINYSTDNLLIYKKYVLDNSWSFGKINGFYNKYFGGILPFDKIPIENTNPVFNETLAFKSKEKYLDGDALTVNNNYLIPALQSGIVVFMGEKEGYGQTIIVQGIDGVDVWYANASKGDMKLYDYIEKGSLIGESIGECFYLVIQKDGKYLAYEEYME